MPTKVPSQSLEMSFMASWAPNKLLMKRIGWTLFLLFESTHFNRGEMVWSTVTASCYGSVECMSMAVEGFLLQKRSYPFFYERKYNVNPNHRRGTDGDYLIARFGLRGTCGGRSDSTDRVTSMGNSGNQAREYTKSKGTLHPNASLEEVISVASMARDDSTVDSDIDDHILRKDSPHIKTYDVVSCLKKRNSRYQIRITCSI